MTTANTHIASIKLEDTDYPLLSPTYINQEIVEKNGNFITFNRLAQLKTALDALQPNPPNATTVWFDNTILLQDASGGTLPSNTLTDTSITITDMANSVSITNANGVILTDVVDTASFTKNFINLLHNGGDTELHITPDPNDFRIDLIDTLNNVSSKITPSSFILNTSSGDATLTIDGSGNLLIDPSNNLVVGSGSSLTLQPTDNLSTTLVPYGLYIDSPSIKTYPTTSGFNCYPAYYTNLELGTSQTINDITPSGFNFVFGDYRNYTKSAGTTSDIERLNFGGLYQIFNWNDANTCKQYVGIRDRFSYNGIDANGRTTSVFNSGSIILNCPASSSQTITNMIATDFLRILANNNSCVYNITNSVSPSFIFTGTATDCSINITNHSCLENSSWNCNLTGAGSSATITNLYGLRLYPPSNQTGLTITNNWGVYSDWSSAKNYFAGGVGIGTTSISNALDVSGNATISTSLQVPKITNTDSIELAPNTTTGDLILTGTNLESSTAGGNAGTHLRIKLNGVYYKIALLND